MSPSRNELYQLWSHTTREYFALDGAKSETGITAYIFVTSDTSLLIRNDTKIIRGDENLFLSKNCSNAKKYISVLYPRENILQHHGKSCSDWNTRKLWKVSWWVWGQWFAKRFAESRTRITVDCSGGVGVVEYSEVKYIWNNNINRLHEKQANG